MIEEINNILKEAVKAFISFPVTTVFLRTIKMRESTAPAEKKSDCLQGWEKT